MDKNVRSHRVGAITAGLSLIAFGIAFVCHIFVGGISYEFIFHMWPLLLVGLGIELLISNLGSENVVYDKGAIFLMIIMAIFAMGMACADMLFQAYKAELLTLYMYFS
ncbi:hypothetical protein D6853_12305 [Butyrivibrio sp. X503]|uniref:LiaF transmembrane domain-containing protein n=1 Tax=Butyrivibrio sp. X503 TaxID=2364878 RepID=UPI000EA862FB|nr:DUF5668 domain-containing protein [Butyrivibrio sp. X503]MBR4670403.1 hypothetical protein [Butyrivibrio sp.]RKM54616.1 hypothetical protein D6853_12305 [Butyrivibrio sp. X503]